MNKDVVLGMSQKLFVKTRNVMGLDHSVIRRREIQSEMMVEFDAADRIVIFRAAAFLFYYHF